MLRDNTTSPAVVVTGASSGIGGTCAVYLDGLGFRVFATVRPGRDAPQLQERASERLTVLELDVTEAATITSAADAVARAVGPAGIAGLVNNAGMLVAGPLEYMPLDVIRKQLEVNTVGQIAVTQAFLPLLRRGRGRIVMIGSTTSLVAFPFIGPYAASKAALHALTDALRVELNPWSIPVSMVIPGNIATPIWDKPLQDANNAAAVLPPEAQHSYGAVMEVLGHYRREAQCTASPPEMVAMAVAHALTARKPRTRYVVGRDARRLELLSRLPDHIVFRLIVRFMPSPKKAT